MGYPKVVLTADRTLMSPYRNLSLATFFGCAPALDPHRDKNSIWYKLLKNQVTPKALFDFICNPISHHNGVADYAPYGLRKVEAGLLRDGFRREDVVVAHPDHIEKFIGPETEVIGTHEMDPLGMGPVTMTFTYGRKQISYDEYYCRDLHMKINEAKKKNGSKAKVLAGASGTWQYNYDPEKIEEYGLYAVLEGELGGIGPEIDGHAGRFFNYLINGDFENMNPFRKRSDFKVDIKEFDREGKTLHGRFVNFWDRPDLDEIPEIVEPSMHGMVEVMRGCGRGCKFCDVTLRSLRYYPPEKVKREVEVNLKKGGSTSAWVHSDDIFVYGMDPRTSKGMEPNREALEELFAAIMSTGVKHSNPTHGTLAGAIADEKLIPNISKIIRSGPDNMTGIQCGFETGSLRLIDKYADRKLAPYQPEEWHWVVKESVKTLNEHYWVPAFTLIMGLDNDETPEDSWETIRIINELEREQPESMFTTTPLTFVPIGLLEKSQFFNIGNEMDPAQLGVMYKTWQHNFKYGIKKFMTKTGSGNPIRKFFFNSLARGLGGVPLSAMEKYARRKSREHERVIETIKAKYW
ncbi:MAG: radical SAM protein [Nitrosopumilaceae archaeon]|nr:B12-binding domain-containing radical SAM protein [Nitrosopumilaceae archaeon]NIT99455.1 B12-binding domain-containing radical SAM protein [Nitrosopumilaceae archaeon]NIU85814.1 radical SAM protein [Nitrosopumilaceae archaeon]NIV64671.1 radical SAM protein [Nitrosopumilaceae archaeon]NIX60058.1 radical SAM protein [Nitrosopumilaceae archaeon]